MKDSLSLRIQVAGAQLACVFPEDLLNHFSAELQRNCGDLVNDLSDDGEAKRQDDSGILFRSLLWAEFHNKKCWLHKTPRHELVVSNRDQLTKIFAALPCRELIMVLSTHY